MKGDRVEVVVDAGGSSRTYEIEATRAGRRVETTHGRGLVEVTEVSKDPVLLTPRKLGASLWTGPNPAPRRAEDDEPAAVRPVRAA